MIDPWTWSAFLHWTYRTTHYSRPFVYLAAKDYKYIVLTRVKDDTFIITTETTLPFTNLATFVG